MSQIIETQLTAEQKETLRYVARLIIVGSKGHEQCFGHYFTCHEEDWEDVACCAIGACLIAATAPKDNRLVLSDWLNIADWPEINYPADVPAWEQWNVALYGGIKRPIPLVDVVMQLNDKAQWSFRRIAAYLRLAAQKGVVTTTTP